MTAASDLDTPASGRLVDGEHRLPLRVYFEDTDLSGVVYHANYLRYMERARSDLLRILGIDQRAHLEASGQAYAISRLSIAYKAPARLDDALLVVSHPLRVGAAFVDIQQRVMRERLLLAQAEVTVALVGANGRPARQPAEWRRRFDALLAGEKDGQ